jgi:hypothetical protein
MNDTNKLLKTPNGYILRCAHNGAIDPKYGPEKHIVGSGRWMREEIAIVEGRQSFTPDVTMVKGKQSLGPIANSVVQDHI